MSATECSNSPRDSRSLLNMNSMSGEARATSVPELLAASFSSMPINPAAEFKERVLSRPEIADQSDRLASWLIANGAGSGTLVGIYMERSIEMLVSVLAVFKAGAAYVPLDPMFPRMRVEQILSETKIPIVLTLTRQMPELQSIGARLLCVDGEAGVWRAQPLEGMPDLHPDMLAYVIFTSGSTGLPKGVEVTHGSVVNLLQSAAELLEVNDQDRLFAVTTLAFDISVLELLLPLATGGTVLLAEQEVSANGKLLAEQLASTRATLLQATPITFRLLLDEGYAPPSGFKMLCGGEAWTMALAEKMLATGARVWNMYGPTETTVWSSIAEVKSGEAKLTIGAPIANTRFYVVDEGLKQVAPGESGELLISGAGVARGYFERPSLTAERFLPDLLVAGQRMYRTGDEVRQLGDSRIEFIGRLDQQIKLRGYRIELGEIETAMMACEGIRESVVTLRTDDSGEPFLAGFYTAAGPVSAGILRESLGRRLPAYMVPRLFEPLEVFPLTPNGKMDRQALAIQPLASGVVDIMSVGEARSQTEQEMVGMWEKLFPGVTIGPDSDFFELGGDSLLLVLLQSMISSRFGLRLNAIDITNYFTVRTLSEWVEERQASNDSKKSSYPDPRLLPLQTLGTGNPIFILPQLMVFRSLAEELGSEQPVYSMQMMDDDVPPETDSMDMDALARLYIRLMRTVQPKGPYRVGGWCMWGWMAYEVARVLEEQGETVDIVVMIDALAPGFWEKYSLPRQIAMSGVIFMHRLRWFASRLWRSSRATQDKESLRRRRTLAVSIATALPRRLRPREFVMKATRLEQLVSKAAATYHPSAIRANVVVFKSEGRPSGRFMGRDMGWGAVLGRPVQVNTLPGNHNEILQPRAARVMAVHVRQALGLEPAVVSQSE
jgi:amino acid adenylation domain-containing protein